jgi:hypothetical protein
MEVERTSLWRERVVETRLREGTVEGWEKRRLRWDIGS